MGMVDIRDASGGYERFNLKAGMVGMKDIKS